MQHIVDQNDIEIIMHYAAYVLYGKSIEGCERYIKDKLDINVQVINITERDNFAGYILTLKKKY